MTGFDTLQGRFVRTEFSAFGLSGQDAAIFQPPIVLPDGDDAALWGWFNAIPRSGPIYAPSGSDFFEAYSAVIGALVSGGGPLDPIAAAQARLAAWGSAPPSWSSSFAGMSRLLAGAPGLTFDFDAAPMPEPAFWGLLGGAPSPRASDPGAIFASGAVQARVACAHLLTFAPRPGDWYVSSALALAYRTPGAAPWNPASPVTWETAFGPNGSLRRMLAALIIVSGLDASATSTARFDAADQKRITAGAKDEGAWPYYLPSTAATTRAAFDEDGRLDLTIRSKPRTAVALAVLIQDAASYLGA